MDARLLDRPEVQVDRCGCPWFNSWFGSIGMLPSPFLWEEERAGAAVSFAWHPLSLSSGGPVFPHPLHSEGLMVILLGWSACCGSSAVAELGLS